MSKEEKAKERVFSLVRLSNQPDAGLLDDLECPACGHRAVTVWFTRPAANYYKTWFICADCDSHTRAQDAQKPKFFSEDRINTVLQEHDLNILKQSRFKRPPQQLM